MRDVVSAALRTPGRIVTLAAVAGLAVVLSGGSQPARAQAGFHVGVPTIVDPIRGGGEPFIAVDNASNTWISAPAGTSTQTSWFWHSRDQGLTFPVVGPSGGHWVCNAANVQVASGGGDSHILIDHTTGDVYVVDQEALASLGFGKADASGQHLTSSCVSAPAVSADRPFQALLHPGAAPQSTADPAKTLVYLSFLCSACGATATGGPGALVYGWSDDGVTWHAADPGSPIDNPIANTLLTTPAVTSFGGHGTMVVDQSNGFVYTALSCNGSCPNGDAGNEFGIVVGAPGSNAANIGEFSTETFVPTAIDGKNGVKISEPGILFPIITMDSAGTMYEAWVSGSGTATSGAPPADSLHITYVYSKDRAHHYPAASWSKPIVIDQAPSQSAAFPWIVAGDPGHLGAVWMGSNLRQYPSQPDTNKVWHPFMAMSTNADTATPSWQQEQVGIGPNHLSDVCLQGTVGCALVCLPTVQPCVHGGNRNMADFISVDIGPDGGLQMTWANDSNLLATNPDTGVPGLPVTEFAKQVSGPRLAGNGEVSDTRFSTVSQPGGVTDASGDAILDPATNQVDHGTNQPNLDLLGSRVDWDGANLLVHIPVSDLSSLTSPSSSKTHSWWMTTWQFNHTIYFAKAESDAGAAPTFTAGVPSSYDRPGLGATTTATLVNYSGGTTVQGAKAGNEWVITVPGSVVGAPKTGSTLEAVTAYSVLDNGNPPVVSLGLDGLPTDNVPTIVDATAAYDLALVPGAGPVPAAAAPTSADSGAASIPNTRSAVPSGLAVAAGFVALAGIGAGARRRRRRAR
jgi:hypothetical protein